MTHHEFGPSADPIDMLHKAQSGDLSARDRLLGWAYATAHDYYRNKSHYEAALTVTDAQDLASSFYLEFERAWPRIRAVFHYTRRMLKNNLRRHLRRVRIHRHRETLVPHTDLVSRHGARHAEWDRHTLPAWSDDEWRQYRTVHRVLEKTDPATRELIRYRFASPAPTYREIAAHMNTTETALRMRMARFYAAARRAGNDDPTVTIP